MTEQPAPNNDLATVQELEERVRRLTLERNLLAAVVALPVTLAARVILGPRMAKALGDLKDAALQSIGELKAGNISGFFDRVIAQQPAKAAALAEAFVLSRLRRGGLVLMLGLIPTVLLFQQTRLIGQQTKIFEAQTQLLEIQSADVFVERSIADLADTTRVDMPQLLRIAEAIDKLEGTRRQDQLTTLRAMGEDGRARSIELRNLYRTFESQEEAFSGERSLLSQYAYLSVILLVNALEENDALRLHWAEIYDIDLTNSDFSGALMENICLTWVMVPDPVPGAASQPHIRNDTKTPCKVQTR